MMRRLAIGVALLVMGGCASSGTSSLAIDRTEEAMIGRTMGGGAHFGRQRMCSEGTWATDYAGLDAFGLIQMRWSMSGDHYQGGIGSY